MHVIEGVVEPGDQRGRTIGFPTANIALLSHKAEEVHDGVWAGLVEMPADGLVVAAVSVGRRRTFYGDHGERLLEAHLLDVDRDLYGQRLRVHLLEHLRPQGAFANVDALVAQLGEDVERTRAWARRNHPWLVAAETSVAPLQGALA